MAFCFWNAASKTRRATPSWDHLAQLLVVLRSEPAAHHSLSRAVAWRPQVSTRDFWGSWFMSPLYNVPETQRASPGGILLIRWVCSCVCLVGDIIPGWSCFKNTLCLWSLPGSITEGVPKIRHNQGPVHSENVIKKVCKKEISSQVFNPSSLQWE